MTAGLRLDEGIAAWNVVAYLLFFAVGVLLGMESRLRDAVRRDAWLAGLGALVTFLFSAAMLLFVSEPGADPLLDRTGRRWPDERPSASPAGAPRWRSSVP